MPSCDVLSEEYQTCAFEVEFDLSVVWETCVVLSHYKTSRDRRESEIRHDKTWPHGDG